MKSLLHTLTRMRATQWTWVVAVLLAGFLAYYRDQTPKTTGSAHEPEPIESAATFIPAGYVLVPIEIANYESLDSILGKFGVVDLYLPSDDPKKPAKKVADRLRILRAPLNPSQFAVLAKEEDSARLVTHEGAFTVVVKNPNHPGTEIVKKRHENPSKNAKVSRVTIEVINEERN